MGYLHHANYFVYFEMGRTELLRRCGLRYRDMEERKLYYVVAKIECRFRAPARYDDLLTLRTTAEKLTRVRVDHRYELPRAGQIVTEASSVLVLVNSEGHPTGLPDEWFEILRKGVVSLDDPSPAVQS